MAEEQSPAGPDPEALGVAGETSDPGQSDGRAGSWMSAGVASVGLTSFFSDSGHEIATAVLPSFITSVLHGSAASLGLIEGVSDALTGVLKLVAGPWANDPTRRRRMATSGYLGTAVATGAIGLAGAVWQAGVLRALAWSARGVRSPARDSMLASLAREDNYGRAYGLERAGDNLGAVVGPLLAAGLVSWVGIRTSIYFAFVPGLGAAIAITVAARHARHVGASPARRARLQLRALRDAGLARPFAPIVAFELGNVATTLLILRSTDLLVTGTRSYAAAASLAILVYAGHNVFASVVALGGGHWIDRSGPRVVFGAGAVLYVLAYGGFAIGPHAWWELLIAFALAGSGIGLAETAESTLVARLLPDELRGSGFGALGAIQAVGDFASTVVVGILFVVVSARVGFAYAGAWMVLAVVATGATAALAVPSPDGRSVR